MDMLEEIGLIVTVLDDEAKGLGVRFALRNEPVTVLGVEFDARATTLGHTSWIEATAGHLPAAVLQLVADEHADILKHAVFLAVMAETNKNKPSPSAAPNAVLEV